MNFSASPGFGKKFLNAGNGEWGTGKMQDDLTDAVKWAVAKGYADPKKVCIYGGSYGGYAMLAGLVFTPGAVFLRRGHRGALQPEDPDGFHPALLGPHEEAVAPAHRPGREDEAFNKKISPLFHADKIKVPLSSPRGPTTRA